MLKLHHNPILDCVGSSKCIARFEGNIACSKKVQDRAGFGCFVVQSDGFKIYPNSHIAI